jgi:hypothetical protein
MPREKASINIDIWGDADFRNLTQAAQSLYFKLLSHPKLDYCGVVEFHPGRLAALSREQSAGDVMIAAQELSWTFYCVFDQDTDEVMVRGFLRHDGVLQQPRLAVSSAKAYAAIGSNKIRAVVVHEILRAKREYPDLQAWEKPQMKTLLKQQAVPAKETATDLAWDFEQGYGDAYGRRSGERYGERLAQTSTNATTGPTTATATATPTATRSNDLSVSQSSSYPQPSAPVETVGHSPATTALRGIR